MTLTHEDFKEITRGIGHSYVGNIQGSRAHKISYRTISSTMTLDHVHPDNIDGVVSDHIVSFIADLIENDDRV